jgi:hypothetical protein
MPKLPTRLLSALLALPLVALGARAALAVPNTVSFTARITDPVTGQPVTGPLTLKVAVFDAATAGTMVWEETHAGVPVANGLVYTSLGGVDSVNNGLDGAVFDGRPLFAELTVDGDVLSPRIPIEAVPYAVRSAVADTLQGFDPASVQKRVTGTCPTGNYITSVGADGTVTCAPDGVGTGDITGVSAGTGLSGGGATGDVALSVDTAAIQTRVTGTCSTGNFITAIGASGTVTCAPDTVGTGDITAVTAGTGLTGGGASGSVALSVDTSIIQSRVIGTCPTGNFITAVASNGTVTCVAEAGGDITGVTAGAGLTGGGASGAVALSVDTAVIQARVTGVCPTGNFITAVAANGTVTCVAEAGGDITGVTAGAGLTGGGASGAVALSVDTAVIQARVTGACASGYISAIAANGTVTCSPELGTGDITGVTAGTGLTGGGVSGTVGLAVDTTAIQARVTGACASGYISAIAANGTVTCTPDAVGSGDITDVIAGTGLAGGAASGAATLGIANLGVTSAMLAAGAVTAGKIATDAVGSAEIAAGAVGTAEIAANAVTTTQILDGNVTMAKTSAPIGMSSVNPITNNSINGTFTLFPAQTMKADSIGSCFVTAWSQSSTNASFAVQPALLNTTTLAVVLPTVTALVQSDFNFAAQSSAVIPVAAGVTYRPGCYYGAEGYDLSTAECRVSWTCN